MKTAATAIFALALGAMLGFYVTFFACSAPQPRIVELRRSCDYARADAGFVIHEMLSGNRFDRDAVRGVYDRVLLEQRLCALFSAPIALTCRDDGCRAAALASSQLLLPVKP